MKEFFNFFESWPGEIIAILGPMYASKTTFLRSLCQTRPPEERIIFYPPLYSRDKKHLKTHDDFIIAEAKVLDDPSDILVKYPKDYFCRLQ